MWAGDWGGERENVGETTTEVRLDRHLPPGILTQMPTDRSCVDRFTSSRPRVLSVSEMLLDELR